mgnify:CR=1 FL=1
MRQSILVDGQAVARGDTVMIKANGLKGKVMMIGQHGLVSLHIPNQPIAASRPYAPSELTLAEEGCNPGKE